MVHIEEFLQTCGLHPGNTDKDTCSEECLNGRSGSRVLSEESRIKAWKHIFYAIIDENIELKY